MNKFLFTNGWLAKLLIMAWVACLLVTVSGCTSTDSFEPYKRRSSGSCPAGYLLWCEERVGEKRCSCVRSDDARDAVCRMTGYC